MSSVTSHQWDCTYTFLWSVTLWNLSTYLNTNGTFISKQVLPCWYVIPFWLSILITPFTAHQTIFSLYNTKARQWNKKRKRNMIPLHVPPNVSKCTRINIKQIIRTCAKVMRIKRWTSRKGRQVPYRILLGMAWRNEKSYVF